MPVKIKYKTLFCVFPTVWTVMGKIWCNSNVIDHVISLQNTGNVRIAEVRWLSTSGQASINAQLNIRLNTVIHVKETSTPLNNNKIMEYSMYSWILYRYSNSNVIIWRPHRSSELMMHNVCDFPMLTRIRFTRHMSIR